MKLITQFPIAYDSPDHIHPWGTAADNHTNTPLIEAVEKHFDGRKISFMDVGCSGGQFAVDFSKRGHRSVGLEGSDYSVIHRRANWPEYHNKVLFTCDASKPYEVQDDDGNRIIFDCISSWECIEHIHPDGLDQFFLNVANHMNDKSIFFGSICLNADDVHSGGVQLHQALLSMEQWTYEILPKYFKSVPNVPPMPPVNGVDQSLGFYYMFDVEKENVRWGGPVLSPTVGSIYFSAMLK